MKAAKYENGHLFDLDGEAVSLSEDETILIVTSEELQLMSIGLSAGSRENRETSDRIADLDFPDLEAAERFNVQASKIGGLASIVAKIAYPPSNTPTS
jgi:hypothetical protein